MSLAMMMDSVRDKQRRQRMILELVRQFAVDSQEAMVSELASRGCTVSQATLSRDLRELRVLRVPTEHGYRYLPAEDSAVGMTTFGFSRPSLATMEVEEVVANEALIVVRTLPARAQGVGVHIDSLRHPDILGTVAGDDTVLVVPVRQSRTAALRDQIAAMFGVS